MIDEIESCTFLELKNKSQIIGTNLLKSIKDDYEENLIEYKKNLNDLTLPTTEEKEGDNNEA